MTVRQHWSVENALSGVLAVCRDEDACRMRHDKGPQTWPCFVIARAAHIVERLVFGGSFVTVRPEPNDVDCVVVLHAAIHYDTLHPFQRWVADTSEASRRYQGDIFVARADQATLPLYLAFFAVNRQGKQVGLVEVAL